MVRARRGVRLQRDHARNQRKSTVNDDIVDVGDDGNCGFRAIAVFLEWGEESWSLTWTQLDTQVHQHPQLFSNLLYDMVFIVRNVLQVDHFGVQGIDK
ncbi:hypothetical protein KIW84_052303 [Lathyrus oleraceus]|uniref:OTU domain-containing protein n=1 Tax=Pisum sativum TaxID=3888 RepID=A0A9D4WPI0_PEA|nr:hypothetical protein KIW84_052303 [Pisum sativum]